MHPTIARLQTPGLDHTDWSALLLDILLTLRRLKGLKTRMR